MLTWSAYIVNRMRFVLFIFFVCDAWQLFMYKIIGKGSCLSTVVPVVIDRVLFSCSIVNMAILLVWLGSLCFCIK